MTAQIIIIPKRNPVEVTQHVSYNGETKEHTVRLAPNAPDYHIYIHRDLYITVKELREE